MIPNARTGTPVGRRARRQAIELLDMCASGREFAVYVRDAVDFLDAPAYGAAHALAYDAVCAVDAETGSYTWKRENYAEAAQRLREGSL